MRITKRLLRRIINEEIFLLSEARRKQWTVVDPIQEPERSDYKLQLASPKIIEVVDTEEYGGPTRRVVAVFKLPSGRNWAFYRSTGQSMGWGENEWFPIDGWATLGWKDDSPPGGSTDDVEDYWWVKTFKKKVVPEGTPHHVVQQAIKRGEEANGNIQPTESVTIEANRDPQRALETLSYLNRWLRDVGAIRTAHTVRGNLRRPVFGLYE